MLSKLSIWFIGFFLQALGGFVNKRETSLIALGSRNEHNKPLYNGKEHIMRLEGQTMG